jgi:hypothetical protein
MTLVRELKEELDINVTSFEVFGIKKMLID